MSVASLSQHFSSLATASQPTSPTKLRSTPTSTSDPARQIAFPPPLPRSTVRTTDQGITSVHVGIRPRQPTAKEGEGWRRAERVGGFGEDLMDPRGERMGGERRGRKEDDSGGREGVPVRPRPTSNHRPQPSLSPDEDDDPRAGSGTPAFRSTPSRGRGASGDRTADPSAERNDTIDMVAVREREKARIAERGKVVVNGTKSVPEQHGEEAEEEEVRRPSKKTAVTSSPRKPRVEDRSERSSASRERDDHLQPYSERDRPRPPPDSPFAAPRTFLSQPTPKTSHSHATPSIPSDDRTDGIYTYDYSTGASQSRLYPLLPEDDKAYGIPNRRRVIAVLKEKQMLEDGEKGAGKERRRERRREEGPMIIGGRQVVEPGTAMSYLSRKGLKEANRAEGTGSDRLVGISDPRADIDGVRLAKMTGYVPARPAGPRSVASSTTGSGSSGRSARSVATVEEEEEMTPRPKAARTVAASAKWVQEDRVATPSRTVKSSGRERFPTTLSKDDRTTNRALQPRKISSEPGIRSRAQQDPDSPDVEYSTGNKRSSPLKTSKSATPFRCGDNPKSKKSTSLITPEDQEALLAQQAWDEYYQQMEEWMAAATAAGYDVSQMGLEGYPNQQEWWASQTEGYEKDGER